MYTCLYFEVWIATCSFTLDMLPPKWMKAAGCGPKNNSSELSLVLLCPGLQRAAAWPGLHLCCSRDCSWRGHPACALGRGKEAPILPWKRLCKVLPRRESLINPCSPECPRATWIEFLTCFGLASGAQLGTLGSGVWVMRGMCPSSLEFLLSCKHYISFIFHHSSAVYWQMDIDQPRQPGQSELWTASCWQGK